MPYASFPYADHALRKVGIADPNVKAEASEAHCEALFNAAGVLRTMVEEMENLEDIKGFITYSIEEERPKPAAASLEEDKTDIDRLEVEAG